MRRSNLPVLQRIVRNGLLTNSFFYSLSSSKRENLAEGVCYITFLSTHFLCCLRMYTDLSYGLSIQQTSLSSASSVPFPFPYFPYVHFLSSQTRLSQSVCDIIPMLMCARAKLTCEPQLFLQDLFQVRIYRLEFQNCVS